MPRTKPYGLPFELVKGEDSHNEPKSDRDDENQ